jgi:hypothetical protein
MDTMIQKTTIILAGVKPKRMWRLVMAFLGLGFWLLISNPVAAGKIVNSSATAALPALTPEQHFALANEVLAQTKRPEFRVSDSVEDGVRHAEEALKLGYKDKKEAQLLLLQLLDLAGSGLSECGSVYNPNAASIPEVCKQHEMAWRKWKSLLRELYRSYPNDTYIMFRYAHSPLPASAGESELILRRLVALQPDNLSLKNELADIDHAAWGKVCIWFLIILSIASLILVWFKRTSFVLALLALAAFALEQAWRGGSDELGLEGLFLSPFLVLALILTFAGFRRVLLALPRKEADRNYNVSPHGNDGLDG